MYSVYLLLLPQIVAFICFQHVTVFFDTGLSASRLARNRIVIRPIIS